MSEAICETLVGDGPILAAAIHDGHAVRPEVAELLALSDEARLREEDPHTAAWAEMAETRIVGRCSRFQVDLNRPREKAVYRKRSDAWGLKVWKRKLPDEVTHRSLAEYDLFYAEAHRVLAAVGERHPLFVVYDLHSYNHRRNGPDGEAAPPDENPEVNLGTGTMDREFWAPLVDRFLRDLRAFDFGGRCLDVRENVKFRGGRFPRWIHERFPRQGCALAIEFKKFFMDEWTGELDVQQHGRILAALRATVAGVREELARLEAR